MCCWSNTGSYGVYWSDMWYMSTLEQSQANDTKCLWLMQFQHTIIKLVKHSYWCYHMICTWLNVRNPVYSVLMRSDHLELSWMLFPKMHQSIRNPYTHYTCWLGFEVTIGNGWCYFFHLHLLPNWTRNWNVFTHTNLTSSAVWEPYSDTFSQQEYIVWITVRWNIVASLDGQCLQ